MSCAICESELDGRGKCTGCGEDPHEVIRVLTRTGERIADRNVALRRRLLASLKREKRLGTALQILTTAVGRAADNNFCAAPMQMELMRRYEEAISVCSDLAPRT